MVEAVEHLHHPVALLLWGAFAQKMAGYIPEPHVFVRATHPSPLSAKKGFLGTKPFSRADALLAARGAAAVDWRLEG